MGYSTREETKVVTEELRETRCTLSSTVTPITHLKLLLRVAPFRVA